mmetsp:Transcript_32200/g.80997  ORF Transcript_32200/g.80997 Transcript_32200/m.80997 type:complete len:233 (-) Transcript_32200:387-1085(-)
MSRPSAKGAPRASEGSRTLPVPTKGSKTSAPGCTAARLVSIQASSGRMGVTFPSPNGCIAPMEGWARLRTRSTAASTPSGRTRYHRPKAVCVVGVVVFVVFIPSAELDSDSDCSAADVRVQLSPLSVLWPAVASHITAKCGRADALVVNGALLRGPPLGPRPSRGPHPIALPSSPSPSGSRGVSCSSSFNIAFRRLDDMGTPPAPGNCRRSTCGRIAVAVAIACGGLIAASS